MNSGGGRAAGDEPGTFRQPRVDLVQLIQRATEFARLWRMQDGCSATVLDELADAIEGYVGDREVTPSAYYCPECATKRPLADPCEHVDIEPGTLRRVRELFGVPIDDPVRDRVHREALDRGLRQLQLQVAWASELADSDLVQAEANDPFILASMSGELSRRMAEQVIDEEPFEPPKHRHPGEPSDLLRVHDEIKRRRVAAAQFQCESAVVSELDELLAFMAPLHGRPLPDIARLEAFLDGPEFEALMIAYRHAVTTRDPAGTLAASDAVNAAVRKAARQ